MIVEKAAAPVGPRSAFVLTIAIVSPVAEETVLSYRSIVLPNRIRTAAPPSPTGTSTGTRTAMIRQRRRVERAQLPSDIIPDRLPGSGHEHGLPKVTKYPARGAPGTVSPRSGRLGRQDRSGRGLVHAADGVRQR